MKKRNVTIDDIANELNINISTVSRALKDHPKISDTTKKKVLKTAQQLGYSPNNIATALAKGQSNIVGVMVPSVDENFFASAIRGIEVMLKRNGYRVVISQSHDTVEDEKFCIETMLEARVDGVLASHAMQTTDFKHYRQVLDKGIPLILFDRFDESLDTHVVAIDDFKGAYQTTEHLIKQGCKKIGYVGGFNNVHIYMERFKGYQKALTDYGLEFNEDIVVECDMKREAGQEFAEKMIASSSLPDAVFATSDYSAVGVMQVLKEHGIKIPEQVAVAGFSNESFADFVTPSLTSTEQHSADMGRLAAKLFLEQVNSETVTMVSQKTILATELVIRESTQRKK